MVEQDQRDAAAILSMIEGEFRRAIEAEREFLDWRREHPDASFGEQLHRFAEYIHASERYARSYRRISGTFPERMNEVHELLLPIQGDVSETSRSRRVSDACQAATRRPLNPVSRHRWL